jgi:hypothetical protein
MSACGVESQQEGSSESFGESQKALYSNQQVKIRCNAGNCGSAERCLYTDPTDLLNGSPTVKLWNCSDLVGKDARAHWTAWYSPSFNAWTFQNHSTLGCLYEEPGALRLITVPCDSLAARQNWTQVAGSPGVSYLKNSGSGYCVHPYNDMLFPLGNAMHTFGCGYNNDPVQDWTPEPLF